MAAVCLLVGLASFPAGAGQGDISQYPVPTDKSFPVGITPGRPGELWFTEYDASKIGRITTSGEITHEFPLPAGARPYGIVLGPDGNLWFTMRGANQIGRMTLQGEDKVYFQVPTASSEPIGIAVAPDRQSLWFTEYAGNKIGRISLAGEFIGEFALKTAGSYPLGITAGPDGNMWFTERKGHKIGRITPEGVITEFPTPTPASGPAFITVGPDEKLWFTEYDVGKIGTITTGGLQADYAVPSGSASKPHGIASGPDGALWFTEAGASRIGRITTDGSSITEFPSPPRSLGAGENPHTIAAGSDGAMWFTLRGGTIGRITTDFSPPTHHERSVSLTSLQDVRIGDRVYLRVKGRIRVHDEYQACLRKNAVIIEKKRGTWRKVIERGARADGTFTFDMPAHTPGLYRARIKAAPLRSGDICGSDTSEPRRHAH